MSTADWAIYAAVIVLTLVGVTAVSVLGGAVLGAFAATCFTVLGTTHGYSAGRRDHLRRRREDVTP